MILSPFCYKTIGFDLLNGLFQKIHLLVSALNFMNMLRVGLDARDKAVDKNHTKARWRMHNWTLRHYVQHITNCLFHSKNQKRSRIYHVTIIWKFGFVYDILLRSFFNLFIPVPFKNAQLQQFQPDSDFTKSQLFSACHVI